MQYTIIDPPQIAKLGVELFNVHLFYTLRTLCYDNDVTLKLSSAHVLSVYSLLRGVNKDVGCYF